MAKILERKTAQLSKNKTQNESKASFTSTNKKLSESSSMHRVYT